MTDIFIQLCKANNLFCQKEYQFHATRKWRFDYCFFEHKLALEVEGGVWSNGRHTRGKGFLGDMEKYNEAAALGWVVLRVTPATLMSMKTIDLVNRVINVRKT